MDTLDALRRRASTRAFLDHPVDDATLHAILDAARWAPSGVNVQPWDVAVVRGATKARIGAAILAARAAGTPENPDYRYYPAEWAEPYKSRRRACGLALYKAQGIGRDDEVKRLESWNANYRFFDAPVGLFVFLDRRLGQGAWLDLGMFMQSIMLAATSLGLATCPQASVADFPDIVRRALGREDEALLVGGIALGYADPNAPVNQYRTEREPVDAFTRFYS
jgi:nitroreductase